MTGIDPEILRRRLRWAAEQLDLDANASPEEVRAAWLRLLPEQDFVPPSEWRWALDAMLHRQPDGKSATRADEAASLEEEDRLRDEVEAFAGEFWDLPPDRRCQRWRELKDRCAFAPALPARLGLLEPGLGGLPLPRETEEASKVVELANQVLELFVLRPADRARARQAFLQRIGDARQEWNAAARRLRQIRPTLASVGADLLDVVEVAPAKPRGHLKSPAPQPEEATAEWQMPRWVYGLIVFIGMGVIRGCMHNENRSPSYTAPSQSFPAPDLSDATWDDVDEAMKRLLKDSSIEKDLKKRAEEKKRQREPKNPVGEKDRQFP